MPTIAEQLEQLESDRADLVDNLEAKGITGLSGDETFTELVPEVLNIPSGSGGVAITDFRNFFYRSGPTSAPSSASDVPRLAQIDDIIAYINSLHTTSLAGLFSVAPNTSQYFSNVNFNLINTTGVTNFSAMFNNLSGTAMGKNLDISSYDLSSATDLSYMFYGVFKITLPANQTIQNANCNSTFRSAKTLTSIIPTWTFRNITDCTYMFNGIGDSSTAPNEILDLSGMYETKKLGNMFSNCYYGTILLPNMTCGNNDTAASMFSGDSYLTKIDMRSFEFTKLARGSFSNMFKNVPTNCLILVKNQTQKDWFTTNFSELTNVQIASEYEANQ